jgi:hypothetical protein
MAPQQAKSQAQPPPQTPAQALLEQPQAQLVPQQGLVLAHQGPFVAHQGPLVAQQGPLAAQAPLLIQPELAPHAQELPLAAPAKQQNVEHSP